jgi:hypothetical protein
MNQPLVKRWGPWKPRIAFFHQFGHSEHSRPPIVNNQSCNATRYIKFWRSTKQITEENKSTTQENN